VLFLRLGVWQLDRLRQRQILRATLQTRLRQPAIEVTQRIVGIAEIAAQAGAASDSLNYRAARARGVFDLAHQVVVLGRVLDEVPGVYLATPLRLGRGEALMVERGWVASPDMQTVALDHLAEPESVSVGGVLLRPQAARGFTPREGSWPLYTPADDPQLLSSVFPYPLLPWVLRRTEPVPGMPAGLKPIPLPVIDTGPHLWYAIQWFSFALIALVGSVAWVLREPESVERGAGPDG
jgi:surfeit locus 1 family protein